MRLTDQQIHTVREVCMSIAGPQSRIRVFGSRLDDATRGGDLDILLESAVPIANPALVSAQISARISRAMDGRKVDVLLSAPNLQRLPIHEVAFKEGVLL